MPNEREDNFRTSESLQDGTYGEGKRSLSNFLCEDTPFVQAKQVIVPVVCSDTPIVGVVLVYD